jgi:hypothetical protein
MNSLKRPASNTIVAEDPANLLCLECSSSITKGFYGEAASEQSKQHFTEHPEYFAYSDLCVVIMDFRKCPKPNCTYQTRCQSSWNLHKVLNLCKPSNAVRWPLGMPSNSLNQRLVECTKCGYSSLDRSLQSWRTSADDSAKIWRHPIRSQKCKNAKVKYRFPQKEKETKICSDEEIEIELFGLRRLADGQSPPPINDQLDTADEMIKVQ